MFAFDLLAGHAARGLRLCLGLGACLVAGASAAADSVGPDPVLQEIRESGVVKIGYLADNNPFSFPKGPSSVAGFSIDICSKVVEQLQRTLQLKRLDQKYVEVQSDERIPKLKAHDIHMECGASTNTTSRQRDVAFSYTMFVSSVRMMARKGDGIVDYRELAAKKVAVLKGSTAEQAITLAFATWGFRRRSSRWQATPPP